MSHNEGLNTLANALTGFSAGVAGQLPQLQAQQAEQKRQLSDERRRALLADNRSSLQFVRAGDIGSAVELLQNRAADIERLGGDPSDTLGQLNLLQSELQDTTGSGGFLEQFLLAGNVLDDRAVDRGFLPALDKPEQDKFISQSKITGKVLVKDPSGRFVTRDVEGLEPEQIPDKFLKIEKGQVFMRRPNGEVFAQPIKDFVQKDDAVDLKALAPINKSVGALVKDAASSRAAAGALARLSLSASATDKLAAVFKFMKSLDPQSVVREGEQAQAVSTGGATDVMIGFVNQLRGEGKLSQKSLDNMVLTAKRLANQASTDAQETVTSYLGGFGSRLNEQTKKDLLGRIPPLFIVIDEVRPPQPAPQQQPVTPQVQAPPQAQAQPNVIPTTRGRTDSSGQFTIGGGGGQQTTGNVSQMSDAELRRLAGF